MSFLSSHVQIDEETQRVLEEKSITLAMLDLLVSQGDYGEVSSEISDSNGAALLLGGVVVAWFPLLGLAGIQVLWDTTKDVVLVEVTETPLLKVDLQGTNIERKVHHELQAQY